jgi:hypothetical protein
VNCQPRSMPRKRWFIGNTKLRHSLTL